MSSKKTIERKVYGILIEFNNVTFLSVQYAYSLEEAFNLARLEFKEQNEGKIGIDAVIPTGKINLFAIKSVKELNDSVRFQGTEIKRGEDAGLEGIKEIFGVIKKDIDGMKEYNKAMKDAGNENRGIEKKNINIDVIKIPPISEKNKLMKEIITKNDRKMYELHKNSFTVAECAYIEKHLK